MKKYDGSCAIWWFVAIVVILTFVAYKTTFAGFAYTQEGFEGGVSFQHSDGSSCDSARFFFGYDGAGVNSDNLYTSIKLTPINSDSSTLEGTGLDLDSTGMHVVEIYFWLAGSSDSTGLVASWLHLPAAIGGGAHAIRYYAVDTSTVPDDTLTGVQITIRTMAGVLEDRGTTNSFGYFDFNLDTDSFVVIGNRTRYAFERDTINVTAADSAALDGFQNWSAPTPPANANLSTVHGFAYGLQEVGLASATVEFWVAQTPIFNICDTSVIMIPQKFTTPTNDTGLFSIDLLKSSCMVDKIGGSTNIEWKVKITVWRDGEAISREHTFEIPSDSSSYFLSF